MGSRELGKRLICIEGKGGREFVLLSGPRREGKKRGGVGNVKACSFSWSIQKGRGLLVPGMRREYGQQSIGLDEDKCSENQLIFH